MEVQCHQVGRRYKRAKPRPPARYVVELTIIVDGQAVVVNLGRDIRPYLGSLNPQRQEALIATMPPRIEVVRMMKHRKLQYRLAAIDAKFWAEQAQVYLAKRQVDLRLV